VSLFRREPKPVVRLAPQTAILLSASGVESQRVGFESLATFLQRDYATWLLSIRQAGVDTVRVELTNTVCRFFTLPPLPDLHSQDELNEWVALRFESRFEAERRDWVIRCQPALRHSGLAVALRRHSLEALTAAHEQAGIDARAIQPRFCSAYHARRRDLSGEDAVVDVSDDSLLCVWQKSGHLVDLQMVLGQDARDRQALHARLASLHSLQRSPSPQRVSLLGAAVEATWNYDRTRYRAWTS
jgi:hypothetical protein